MVRVDVAGWMTLNPRTLPALIKFGSHAGVRLALLSNAPEPLATAIDQGGWSPSFDRRFYSCRLGLAKPDSAAYEAVLDDLGATPQSVLLSTTAPQVLLGQRRGVDFFIAAWPCGPVVIAWPGGRGPVGGPASAAADPADRA
jgi:hypothetical protein